MATSSPAQSEAERDALLAAMVRLAGTRGYPATSASAVCEEAGVESGAFGRHFAAREQCALEAWDLVIGRLLQRYVSAFEGGDWREKLRSGSREILRSFEEDPAAARFVAIEIVKVGPKGIARRDLAFRNFAALIDQVRTELDPDAGPDRDTATKVVGSVYRTLYEALKSGEEIDGERLMEELLYVSVMPYFGEAEARTELRGSS